MDKRLGIYCTVKDRAEAEKLGTELVEKRLAACVNIVDGMTSIYAWKGQIEKETEVILIAKTTADRYPELERCLRALHSYECPCIVAFPIERGFAGYLDWITAQTRPVEGA